MIEYHFEYHYCGITDESIYHNHILSPEIPGGSAKEGTPKHRERTFEKAPQPPARRFQGAEAASKILKIVLFY